MPLRANLFCYGTLMYPAIMRTVCGRVSPGIPAQLTHFQRYTVKGRVFPGIIATPGQVVVMGVLYQGLTPLMMQRLDDYESDFYRRERVMVQTDTDWLPAFTYVIPHSARHHLSAKRWDSDLFARRQLGRYLQRLRHGRRVT